MILSIVWAVADECYHATPFVISVIGTISVVIMLFVIAGNYIGLDAQVQENKMRYEMLKYQYENNFYDNENEVGKYELIKDIREWNEDLSKYKALEHDTWLGVFIPDVYDQFEFIEIGK